MGAQLLPAFGLARLISVIAFLLIVGISGCAAYQPNHDLQYVIDVLKLPVGPPLHIQNLSPNSQLQSSTFDTNVPHP